MEALGGLARGRRAGLKLRREAQQELQQHQVGIHGLLSQPGHLIQSPKVRRQGGLKPTAGDPLAGCQVLICGVTQAGLEPSDSELLLSAEQVARESDVVAQPFARELIFEPANVSEAFRFNATKAAL
jgi:hypothetical protein